MPNISSDYVKNRAMKSKKAENYIDSHAKRAEECFRDATTDIGNIVLRVVQVIRAAEIAEQEAEERMRRKAHKIILDMMTGIFHGDMPRKIADEFIQKLAE